MKNRPSVALGVAGLVIMVTENASAISGAFHSHPYYATFYDKHAEAISGFPGIWTYLATAATFFTQEEIKTEAGPVTDHWIEIVDAYVAGLYAADCIMKSSEMTELAKKVLSQKYT